MVKGRVAAAGMSGPGSGHLLWYIPHGGLPKPLPGGTQVGTRRVPLPTRHTGESAFRMTSWTAFVVGTTTLGCTVPGAPTVLTLVLAGGTVAAHPGVASRIRRLVRARLGEQRAAYALPATDG